MEPTNDIKEALSTRARTATLDELRSEGKKRVRVVKAEHIAAMIEEAVHNALESSGFVAPDEVEKLVDRSRQEFRAILKEREVEAQRGIDAQEALAAREQDLVELRQQLASVRQALQATEQSLVEARAAQAAAEQAAEQAVQQAVEAAETASAPIAAPAVSSDLLMSMMHEMANMKAALQAQQAQPQAVQPATAGVDVSAAIEKLAGSLNDRLEKLGKKMGVSAAVGGDQPLDLGGLFKDDGPAVESNLNNIESKQTAAGGIAANLARLKKLKGGG
jgi:DNA repair exonuclease SbcCD ATPase subunit